MECRACPFYLPPQPFFSSCVDEAGHTPAPFLAHTSGLMTSDGESLLRGCDSLLRGFGGCRGFPATFGLGRGSGCFADHFRRQHTGHEQLGPVVIEVDSGTLLIRCGHDAETEKFMLDGLAFLHYLH